MSSIDRPSSSATGRIAKAPRPSRRLTSRSGPGVIRVTAAASSPDFGRLIRSADRDMLCPPRENHFMSLPLTAMHDVVPFAFLGERLWLDFVNTDDARRGSRVDLLRDFDALVRWLEGAAVLDGERGGGIRRRALQQPAGATAALADARRIRAALRSLAERGMHVVEVRLNAVNEINRVLGRSAGTRRLEARGDGTFQRSFVPVGDAFAGLMIPVVESAADALVLGELARVRRCADARCPRVFFDETKNGRRRWCDMATCGNRAKAARHRQKVMTHV
jgi:predicted RNA-binding Zn ribbon-like protein